MNNSILTTLGWSNWFQQQVEFEELETFYPARVMGMERGIVHLMGEDGESVLEIQGNLISEENKIVTGDWLLLDKETNRFERLLERKSLFKRKAPGKKVDLQLIASNVDVVFIVTSCNEDFNLSRIERYLALSAEAGVSPVIVLTKMDLCDEFDGYLNQLENYQLPVEFVNSHDENTLSSLKEWGGNGTTIAFLGSSGVGKSTIINTLIQNNIQKTGEIRENDSKGRHITSSRTIHLIPENKGLLLDCPGMREIQITDCVSGIREVFSEIEEYSQKCRFDDCTHSGEPGCAVHLAIQKGEIQERRVKNYHKLAREEKRNSQTITEKRKTEKGFGKMIKSVMNFKQKNR